MEEFHKWIASESQKKNTTLIDVPSYEEIVVYLKTGVATKRSIKKGVKKFRYQLLDFANFNLKDVLVVPSKEVRKLKVEIIGHTVCIRHQIFFFF